MNSSPIVVIKCRLNDLATQCWNYLPTSFTPERIYPSGIDGRIHHFTLVLDELEKRGYTERSMSYDPDRDWVLYVFVLKKKPG